MKCRFIDGGYSKASYNMGLDEAILDAVSKGISPTTLRFYGWKPHAISIGYFQSASAEVDFNACEKYGVDLVRRITGGGAVYHADEITYSFITPQDSVPADILESYGLICSGITEGLKNMGVDSQFAPINDIVSGGKKISGNAQTRRKKCVLQHGTILLDVDAEKMFSLLKVSDEKIRDKMILNVKERVTSIKDILGCEITYEQASNHLKKGFEKALNLKLFDGKPSGDEVDFALNLILNKYSNSNWNMKR